MNLTEALNILAFNKKDKYKDVKKFLEECSSSYYNTDSIIISDREYDVLYQKYKEKTGETIIGSLPLVNATTIEVEHSYKNLVGTLDKVTTIEDCRKFIESVLSKVDLFEYEIRLSLKFDGNSITNEYKGNKLLKSLTRGKDGKGKDLTNTFIDHPSIMRCIDELFPNDEEFAIKYEAICSYENYEQIKKDFNEDYANPRSMISGLLGRKEDFSKYKKYITLVPLELRIKNNNKNHKDQWYFEKIYPDNWFNEYAENYICSSLDRIMEKIENYYNKIIKIRESLPFMIDGIVINFLDEEVIDNLGYTPNGEIPKFAIAFKLPYLEEVSEVTGMDFTMGDSGRITPVCYFKPVHFNGTEHTKQSISNYKRFTELGLGIGSKILVSYNHDCLSYITKMICDENDNIEPIEFIDTCPICGGDLTLNEEETFVTCENPECSGRIVGVLQNYLIKMGIKGIKRNTLIKLYESGLVKTIPDLYEMNYDKIKNIEGLGESTAELLKSSLNNKEYYDWEIIGSLGIDNIGRSNAKELFRVMTMDELIDHFNNDSYNHFISVISNIDGFSDIQADHLWNGINDNAEIIDYLMERGYKTLKSSVNLDGGEMLRFVFTEVRDPELQDKLESMGHKITNGGVSKKTNVLICANPNGNTVKLQKAREYGTIIMSIDEARKKYL